MPSEQRPNQQQDDQDNRQRDQQGGNSSGQKPARRQPTPGITALSTSDPAIKSGHRMIGPAEQVVSYQTSYFSTPPEPYPFEAGGDVVQERRGQQNGKKGSGEQGKKQQNDEQGKEQQCKQHNGQQDQKGGQQRGEEQGGEQNRRDGDPQYGERQRKKKKHVYASRAPDWKTLAMSAVLALVCGAGGAWGYSAIFGSSKSDQEDKSSGKGDKTDGKSGGKSGGKSAGDKSRGSGSGEGGASASEIPGFNSAKDADTFKKELEHLAHRLDLLGGRIDRMTTNEEKTPPVLNTVQRKVTDLEREVDEVANLPSKFNQLERKLSNLKEEFKMLRDRVSGSELPVGSSLAPADSADRAAEPLAATADPADEATLKLAAGLLREGHYSQSYEVLRRLQRERPKDARVWYFSALAHGLLSGKWDGQTKRLAEQGVVCERAGSPSRLEIDRALAGASSAFGDDWLASQRAQATTR